MKKNKILLISYGFHPWPMPAARKWTRVAEELVKRGHEVHVISAWMSGSKTYEKWHGIHIHRPENIFEKIRAGFFKRRSTQDNLNSIQDRFPRKIYRFMIKLCWPDVSILWALYSVKTLLRVLKEGKIDSVISVSLPFSSHLLGLIGKIIYKNMNWLVDIQDPFCIQSQFKHNHPLYRSFNRWIEKKVLIKADCVTVTNPSIKGLYEITYGIKNISVVPHLVSSGISYLKDIKKQKKHTFVFVGTLDKKIRNPRKVFAILDKYIRIHKDSEFHFYGNLKSCIDEFNAFDPLLNKNIFLHGYLEHKMLSTIYSHHSFLINIGNNTPYQLPSKIIDYMASGKPIIHFSLIKNDHCKRILAGYGYGLVLDAFLDVEINAKKLLLFTKSIKRPPILNLRSIMKTYSLSNVTKEYERNLRAIMDLDTKRGHIFK